MRGGLERSHFLPSPLPYVQISAYLGLHFTKKNLISTWQEGCVCVFIQNTLVAWLLFVS